MQTQTIENLLQQVSAISKKYEEIAKITGENFNVFRILKVEANEVRTHSAFLAELLDPQGSHGQGDIFLKLFVDKFQFRMNSFETKSANVEVEKFTGFVSDDYSDGGRIDIMITDTQKKRIIIENKIYASDQEKQLYRYNKYDPTADLFYLTLYGDEPTVLSTDGQIKKDKDFRTLSYEDNIREWLEVCRKESATHSILRETITQYINLIKYLTNQTMNDKMKNELLEQIMKSKENIESASNIVDIWEDIRLNILKKLGEKIGEIANELKLKADFNENLGKKESGFWFFKDGWKHSIYFYFDSDFDDLLVGIDHLDPDDPCDENMFSIIKEGLKDFVIGERLSYENWMWVCCFTDWDNTPWCDVSKKMPGYIKEACNKILSELNKLEQKKISVQQ